MLFISMIYLLNVRFLLRDNTYVRMFEVQGVEISMMNSNSAKMKIFLDER